MEKFKKEIDGRIRRQLIKAECSPKSIKQQYMKVVRLDQHYRKSQREEKR